MLKSRTEAFNAGEKYFNPGTICKNGHHNAPRYTSNGGCIACANRFATDRRLLIEGKREVVLRVEVSAYLFNDSSTETLRACAQAAVDELSERAKAMMMAPIGPIG